MKGKKKELFGWLQLELDDRIFGNEELYTHVERVI